jgi:hypothetical protein
MKLIKPVVCLLPFCLLAQTQTAKPAAPQQTARETAEATLRERVKRFYDLLVDGKLRQTEALVCPESQDAYYARTKGKPGSAEIASVKLAEDLKSATVAELIEDNYSLGGIEKKLKLAVPSQWKLVDEQWCYFIPPASSVADTPFGKMDFSGGKDKAAAANTSAAAPEIKPPDLSAGAQIVRFSEKSVSLPFEANGSDEIEITNNMPGPVQLRLSCPNVPGLLCKLDQDQLRAGAQTKLHVAFKFNGAKLTAGLFVDVWILPFQKLVPIGISRRMAEKPQ